MQAVWWFIQKRFGLSIRTQRGRLLSDGAGSRSGMWQRKEGEVASLNTGRNYRLRMRNMAQASSGPPRACPAGGVTLERTRGRKRAPALAQPSDPWRAASSRLVPLLLVRSTNSVGSGPTLTTSSYLLLLPHSRHHHTTPDATTGAFQRSQFSPSVAV